MIERGGLESPFADFLRDFGPALLAKYQPKGILVFSAHWETEGEQLGTLRTAHPLAPGPRVDPIFVSAHYSNTIVTDYGDENPLLMDYYGMSPELYKLQFSSRGDATLSRRVLELFQQVLYLSLVPQSPSFRSDACLNPSYAIHDRPVSALV